MSAIITHEDLKAATGCARTSDLEKCLRKNGVRFLYGKKGIYTTVDALNAAMGLKSDLPQQQTEQEIDIL
ncbi:MAG: hypothetical protein M0Q95_10960 [Porticoccaceae bacterium]|nr:hypothetical protein [Porticoccaceae bacterium]